MIHEGSSRVSIATDGYALVNPVSVASDDVVQLVAHASGSVKRQKLVYTKEKDTKLKSFLTMVYLP